MRSRNRASAQWTSSKTTNERVPAPEGLEEPESGPEALVDAPMSVREADGLGNVSREQLRLGIVL